MSELSLELNYADVAADQPLPVQAKSLPMRFPLELPRPEVRVIRLKLAVPSSQTRPTELLLGTLSDANFRVIKAIPVHLESSGPSALASWREIDEFGSGASVSEACVDLGRTVAELYGSLEADETRLGPDLARVWRVLNEYVTRRS